MAPHQPSSDRRAGRTGLSAPTDTVRVLYADDEPDVLELTAEYLSRENDAIEVTTATSVDAALEELDESVDCVVSDYQMPGRDGLEFLAAVREFDPNLPFVLFTGKGDEEIASEAISAGVTDYLQKETGVEQYAVLANRIENAVASYRARSEVEHGFRALETAREGISLLDADGRFVYVNDAFTDIVGYERAELVGANWELLYPEGDRATVREEILPSVPSGGRWTGETVYVRKDGQRILVDHALAYTDDDTLICILRDMSHDHAKGPLVAEEAFVECLLDALEDVFYVLDTEGNVVRVNRRAIEVTGFSNAELTRMHATDVIVRDDHEAVGRAVRETLETGESELDAGLRTADDGAIPHEFRTRRLTDAEDRVIGLVGIGRDVTERQRRERRLQRQARQFEAFGSVLSHDLRNPLSIVAGRVGILSDHVDEAGLEHLETIERATDRLDALVTDLAAVMKEGDLVSDAVPVEVGTAARTAWDPLDTTDATLEVDGDNRIRADPGALERLFDNLLKNALQHGEARTVTVGALPDGFFVADDGSGIPPADRQTVFEPRVTSAEEGAGFGLVSVRQICLAHGWEVTATESESGGARFEVSDVDVVD